MINPDDVIVLRDGGTANMGDVDGEPVVDAAAYARARFILEPASRMAIVKVDIHFSGSGTGVADCLMKRDSIHGTFYDGILYKFNSVGIIVATSVPVDPVLRIAEDQLIHYIVEDGDHIVFEWTNPDTGNINWGIELSVVRV